VAKPLRLRLNAGRDARVPTANTTTSNEQLTNPIFKDHAEISFRPDGEFRSKGADRE